MSEEFNKPILDILDSYYKLKQQYKDSFHSQYLSPIIQSKNTTNEKRKKYLKLPKPKCVNCKRNVGTLFSIKTNEKYTERIYLAKCGDESQPCSLMLNFTIPNVILVTNEFDIKNPNSGISYLNDSKKNIITIKNDGMFGYIEKDKVDETFKQLTKELEESSNIYENYLEMLINQTRSLEKQEEIDKKKEEFEISKQQFQEYMKEYNKTKNSQVMKNAMDFYIKTIKPLSIEISHLVYPIRYIISDFYDNKDIYKLELKEYDISDLEIAYGKSKIESNKIGLVSLNKTIKKNSAKSIQSSKKTKKILPTFEIAEKKKEEEENKLLDSSSPLTPLSITNAKEIDWGDESEEKGEEKGEESSVIKL